MKRRTDAVILKFKKDLENNGIKTKRIILFGSRARKEHLKHSDYDIIIVSDDFKKIPFLRRAEKMELIWTAKKHADFLCYTPKEFNKKKEQIGIVRVGVKEGIVF